jgi:hypothetical protein
MISQSAKAGIEWLFEKAVRENSVSGDGDTCVLTKLLADKEIPSTTHQQLVVLSISTYLFRIVALFQFNDDALTNEHMVRMTRSLTPDLDEQALSDAYAELVNMVCGAVNRGLGVPFPHIGMSTPYILESSCANYAAALEPQYLQRYEVAINDSMRFNLTVCLCAGADIALDFRIDTYEAEEELAGELELF